MNESTFERVKEELFVSLSLMRAVKSERQGELVNRLSPAGIYQYVLSGVVNTKMDAMIATDRRASVIYRQLVKDHALFHVPPAVAASSGEALMERETQDVMIRLITSRMEQDQIYLQVELRGDLGGKDQAMLNVFGRDDEQAHVELGGFVGDRCQLLMNIEDDVIRLLQQIDSEIFVV